MEKKAMCEYEIPLPLAEAIFDSFGDLGKNTSFVSDGQTHTEQALPTNFREIAQLDQSGDQGREIRNSTMKPSPRYSEIPHPDQTCGLWWSSCCLLR